MHAATTAAGAREYDPVVDVRLFKAIGLHRVLHGGGGGADGPFRRACLALLCAASAVHAAQVAWLPAASHDFPRLTYTAVMLAYGLMTSLKGFALLGHAPRLLAVLDATGATPRRRPASTLLRPVAAAAAATLLRPAVAACYGTYAFWAAAPWFLLDERVAVPRADGTVARYRATVNNMWYPMPETAHNSPAGWAALYAAEALVGLVDVAAWTLFDCYLVTVCLALDARFRAVAAGYATLGRETGPAPAGSGGVTGNDESGFCTGAVCTAYSSASRPF